VAAWTRPPTSDKASRISWQRIERGRESSKIKSMVKGLIVWKRVWTEIAGDSVTGSYAVRDGIVTVQTAKGGSKSTQLGGSTAISIARLLLRELAGAGRA
jgi:hypothetical protein